MDSEIFLRTILSNTDKEALSLPASLEDNLVTFDTNYHGSYEDNKEKQQCLSDKVLSLIRQMTEGQRVLIVEDKEES
jgi:hypothetical protein